MKKHLLRLSVLSSVFCLMSFVSKAQYFTIPDPNFAAWMHTHSYDSCMVGNQLDTFCAVTVIQPTGDLDLSNLGISDLTGLRYIYWNDPYCGNCDPTINVSHNNFTQIPPAIKVLLGRVRKFNLSYNQMDTVILGGWLSSFWPNDFDFSHNNMRYLGVDSTFSGGQFSHLNLNYNLLDTFPVMAYNGSYDFDLEIRANHLTHLPVCKCLTVDCGNNQITSLSSPWMWKHTNIIVDSNLLTGNISVSHSISNSSFGTFNCSHNAITGITFFNFSYMDSFLCNDNNLTMLPSYPTNLKRLDCHNNPNLQCIPNLPHVSVFKLDYSNTAVQCLPHLFPNCIYTSTPSITAVPTCDFYNNFYGCPQYSSMGGIVYSDLDSNCLEDSTDIVQDNIKVQLWSNGNLLQQAYVLDNSFYSFDVDSFGIYTLKIDTTAIPFYVSCPVNSLLYDTITSLDSFNYNMNFALRCKPGFDLVAQNIVGKFRPGNTSRVIISAGDASNFYNAHCATGTSGIVQLIINGVAHYASAASGALTPTSVANDTITWSIADFGAVNFFTDFNIFVTTDANAQIGSPICFTLIVNPIAGDNNPANNILTHCFPVVSSFDPNEKEVYPAGNIDTAQKWLTYTIHFQNTGTAEAQHIYVSDTLDTHVDPASFQLLAYSHQPMVQIKENAVRFNFPNINLPDSNTNEPLSHGYVQYKVKLKENLPVGTNISNTAFIYFDFNSAVVTNTTSNTIALATGIKEFRIQNLEFRMNPNPASSYVNVSVDESMVGSNLTVYDVMGRKMAAVQLQTTNFKLETTRFASGVYFVTIENERGRVTKKLVIE